VRRQNVPWIPALERVYQHYRQTVGLPPIALNTLLTRLELTDPLPMGAGPRHLLLTVQLPPGESSPLSYAAVHKQSSRLFKTVRLWVIASEQVQLADWHLQILEDATPHWIRHGTATLLGLEFATRQLGHSSAGQTATYIAEQSEVHRHKLATLTVSADPSESPRAQAVLTLLNLSIPERVAALRELMRSVEQEAPAELDRLWAGLATDI